MNRTAWIAGVAAAALTGVLLAGILVLHGADLRMPLNYLKDANIFLVRAKSIVEGNWVWRNPRLGAPWGANWIDFPLNITIDSAIMWVFSRFTTSAPLIVNLDWVLELAATAAAAAYAFVRLGFRPALAVAGGVLFALQPYQWIGTHNLHCLPGPTPLLAAAAIEIVRGRRLPAFAWFGCVWAGLAYAYVAFFGCLVLLFAAVLAWMARRDWRPFATGLALISCIAAVALLDLAPSLLYRARNGPNAAMLFKSPAEGEIYGLRLRYLLTPSPDHPLPFMRAIEQQLAPVKFPPIQNENEYARLGTAGSLGFLFLLLYLLAAAADLPWTKRFAQTPVGPCAALTILCIFFAITGGFAVFFDALVTAEIRAWARIFPFIGFFCLAAILTLAAPSLEKLRPKWRLGTVGAIMLLGVFDQAMPSLAYDHQVPVYQADGNSTRDAEALLPGGSSIFQLPFVDFPNDNHPGRMLVNDSLRPYLHSATDRWSAGAVNGTRAAEWCRAVASKPVPEMLSELVRAGFRGLWLDTGADVPTLEPEITRELGAGPLRHDRFLFWDLQKYTPKAPATTVFVFERGFYFPEAGGDGQHSWCLRRGRIEFFNSADQPRDIQFSMQITAADGQPHQATINSSEIQIPGIYSSRQNIPAHGSVKLDIDCHCPGIWAGNRTIYFDVSRAAVSEQ